MAHIPAVEVPAALLEEMRERVWLHTASVFVVERKPRYVGTVTCVAVRGQDYLLTAAHVWNEFRGNPLALSLEADRLLVPIGQEVLEPRILSGSEFGEWGPDLAVVLLPALISRKIKQVKAFYNIDRRHASLGEAQYSSGLWAVVGAPAEQSTFSEREAVLKVSLLASVVTAVQVRDGFDFVDLSYFHEGRPDLPRSYGGVSGSGLWRLPVSRDQAGIINWNGVAHLEGVAFFQKSSSPFEGTIRCHGRISLYERALGLTIGEAE